MNRTLKEATVRRYHHDDNHPLAKPLQDFIHAYNVARRLKTLRGLTPDEFICNVWTSEPNDLPLIQSIKYRD